MDIAPSWYTYLDSPLIAGIAIAATLLTRREFGAVCLPSPNAVAAALGMTLDLILDAYFLFTGFVRLWIADDEDKFNYSLLLSTAVSLFAWHMVFRSNSLLIIKGFTSVAI